MLNSLGMTSTPEVGWKCRVDSEALCDPAVGHDNHADRVGIAEYYTRGFVFGICLETSRCFEFRVESFFGGESVDNATYLIGMFRNRYVDQFVRCFKGSE